MPEKIYVGVMGPSIIFETDSVRLHLATTLYSITEKFPGSEIWIVSRFTWSGVPAIAYRLAKANGWKTVGITRKNGLLYKFFPCDEVKIVEGVRGAELRAMLKLCKVLVHFGEEEKEIREDLPKTHIAFYYGYQ